MLTLPSASASMLLPLRRGQSAHAWDTGRVGCTHLLLAMVCTRGGRGAGQTGVTCAASRDARPQCGHMDRCARGRSTRRCSAACGWRFAGDNKAPHLHGAARLEADAAVLLIQHALALAARAVGARLGDGPLGVHALGLGRHRADGRLRTATQASERDNSARACHMALTMTSQACLSACLRRRRPAGLVLAHLLSGAGARHGGLQEKTRSSSSTTTTKHKYQRYAAARSLVILVALHGRARLSHSLHLSFATPHTKKARTSAARVSTTALRRASAQRTTSNRAPDFSAAPRSAVPASRI